MHSTEYRAQKNWVWLWLLIIAVIGLVVAAILYQTSTIDNQWVWLIFGVFLILLLIAVGLYFTNYQVYQWEHYEIPNKHYQEREEEKNMRSAQILERSNRNAMLPSVESNGSYRSNRSNLSIPDQMIQLPSPTNDQSQILPQPVGLSNTAASAF